VPHGSFASFAFLRKVVASGGSAFIFLAPGIGRLLIMLAFHLILGNAAITVLVELLNKLTRFVCKIAAGNLSILGFHLIQGRKASSL
jgi:hypothetical protein